jgi:S1-C subfamily serine protease
VIKRDETHDLALLLIESRPRGAPLGYLSLPAVPLGDSNLVRTGDTIYVVGYPSVGGASVTVTRGMVAGFAENRTLIKTDAEFSGGSSGGPAISGNGSLIGIPTKVRVEDAGKLGYLVSANEVRRFIR